MTNKLILLFVYLLLSCSISYSADYSFRNDLKSKSNNSYENAKEREKFIINYLKNNVFRDKDKLIIKGIKKEILKTYINSDKGDTAESYMFADVNKRALCILIMVHEYEGRHYEMINYKTGEIIKLDAIPAWSPSNNKFAIANLDLESRYTPNIIQIWSVKGGFTKEWETTDYGGADIKWESDSSLLMLAADKTNHFIQPSIFKYWHLKFVDNEWKREEIAPDKNFNEMIHKYAQ